MNSTHYYSNYTNKKWAKKSFNIRAANKNLVTLTPVLQSCDCRLVPDTRRWKARETRPPTNTIRPLSLHSSNSCVDVRWPATGHVFQWLYNMTSAHWSALNAHHSADDFKFLSSLELIRGPEQQNHSDKSVTCKLKYYMPGTVFQSQPAFTKFSKGLNISYLPDKLPESLQFKQCNFQRTQKSKISWKA